MSDMWREVLANKVKEIGVRRTAAFLETSPSVVSQLNNGRYKSPAGRWVILIMSMWGEVSCPALLRTISLDACRAYQERPPTNGLDLKVEKMVGICRRCLYFKGEKT
ncbi:MAG: hypothetical protein HQL66_03140 [Magnetococcales bacterium]|nr:hypothetical protein [Magnetococcales bacterium]